MDNDNININTITTTITTTFDTNDWNENDSKNIIDDYKNYCIFQLASVKWVISCFYIFFGIVNPSLLSKHTLQITKQIYQCHIYFIVSISKKQNQSDNLYDNNDNANDDI